jgi:hypothetical protein
VRPSFTLFLFFSVSTRICDSVVRSLVGVVITEIIVALAFEKHRLYLTTARGASCCSYTMIFFSGFVPRKFFCFFSNAYAKASYEKKKMEDVMRRLPEGLLRLPDAVQCYMLRYLSASSIFRMEVVSRRHRRIVDQLQRQHVLLDRVRAWLERRVSYGKALCEMLVTCPDVARHLVLAGSCPLQAINGEEWSSDDAECDCDWWTTHTVVAAALRRWLWRHHNIGAEEARRCDSKHNRDVLYEESNNDDSRHLYTFPPQRAHIDNTVHRDVSLQIISVRPSVVRSSSLHTQSAAHEIADVAAHPDWFGGPPINANTDDCTDATQCDVKIPEHWQAIDPVRDVIDTFAWDFCKCAWTPHKLVIDGKAAIRDRRASMRPLPGTPTVDDHPDLLRELMRHARRG